MDRSKRFALFIQRLEAAKPASSFEEARTLLETILNDTEDQFSGAPFNPEKWRTDGRLYPPHDDRETDLDVAGVRTFRSVRHYISLAENGAILIWKVGGSPDDRAAIEIDKPGYDGGLCSRKTV